MPPPPARCTIARPPWIQQRSLGILETTSGYGADAYEFAKDKPIELVDEGGLVYLLEEVGTKARIDMPPDD
jgi:hypothetical protein